MPRIRSIVVVLDDGTYRTIDVTKARSMYLRGLPPEKAILNGGDGDLASPPSESPEWDYFSGRAEPLEAPAIRSDETRGGDPPPPTCYYVDGVWVCI